MEVAALFKDAADQRCFLISQSSVNQHSASCSVLGQEGNGAASHAQFIKQEAEKIVQQYCSFPKVGGHLHQAALEAQGRAWLANLYRDRLPDAQVDRLLHTRLETAGSVSYPQGFSDARSLTLIKLMHWFFLLDDVCDERHVLGRNHNETRRFVCRHFKAMFGEDIKEAQAVGLIDAHGYDVDVVNIDPAEQAKKFSDGDKEDPMYAAGLAKSQKELVIEVGVQWSSEMQAQELSPRQVERLRKGVAEYFLVTISMVRFREEKRLPSVEEYIRLRRMDGAAVAFLGCEFDLGIDIDDDTLEHPLMKMMHARTVDHCLWLNDLLSFNREFHKEEFVNLLGVLHHKNCYNIAAAASKDDSGGNEQAPTKMADFHAAIEEALAMIKDCDQERIRLVQEIVAWRPDLQPYLNALHFTISGLTFWALWSSRYQTGDV